VFVVMRTDGSYYSGAKKRPWTRRKEEARTFWCGPDAYAAAAAVRDRLRGRGIRCNVAYSPRFVVRVS
jgi:hypothetical protein